MPEILKAERSLQQRFALQSALAIGVALLLGAGLMLWFHNVDEGRIFDAHLKQLADTILMTVDDEVKAQQPGAAHSSLQLTNTDQPDTGLNYQVWLRDGTLLLRSQQAPIRQPLVQLSQQGFSTIDLRGETYRAFSLPTRDGRAVVQVAESIRNREQQSSLILSLYLVSLLLPLALTWRTFRFLMRRSFRALNELAAGVDQRDLHDTRPMVYEQAPQEMGPILNSLNKLVSRTADRIALEQRFTSVAAHEIRTPLAGIRAHAQLAGKARTREELRDALNAVLRGVDQASRVFDQLLDLTRIESMSADLESQFERISFPEVYERVMDELLKQATTRRISVSTNFAQEYLQGLDFGIYLLLRNLIANAILYCPEGGRVEVASSLQGRSVVLSVDDSGKGIAPADRERVFERFNRLNQASADGLGLGLSIVAHAVQIHHARIELLTSALGGLRAQVLFPAAHVPPPVLA
jgi:two-component system OmpR family sensor kinase/two-component system sensor histidine kinase QseC